MRNRIFSVLRTRKGWNLRSLLPTLWFTWLVVTLGSAVTIWNSGNPHSVTCIPYGVFNFFTPRLIANDDFRNPNLSVLIAVLVVLFVGDIPGRLIRPNLLRVIYNLVILAALTAAIDLVIQGCWESLDNLELALYLDVQSSPCPPWHF